MNCIKEITIHDRTFLKTVTDERSLFVFPKIQNQFETRQVLIKIPKNHLMMRYIDKDLSL